jgi:4-aminobutyrate aminotransferase-like enzyme
MVVGACDHTPFGRRHCINKSMTANPVNMIVLAPPLIISTDEFDEGVAIMNLVPIY